MHAGHGRVRLTVALALILAGCATTLQPAPHANRVPGRFKAAVDEVAGVRVIATVDAWRGFPERLEDELVPMLVTLENDGPRPISVRYASFALETPSGARLAALPPSDIRDRITERVSASLPPHSGFSVAPYPSAYHPAWLASDGPFFPDRLYYDRYSLWLRRPPAYRVIQLPTRDMIQHALPEGVIEPGGAVSGFVYFEKLPRDVDTVVFTARVVDAASAQELGQARIPFVAE